VAFAALFAPLPEGTMQPTDRQVTLDARMFAFAPARLRVDRGDRVTLTLHSVDVVHGVHVDGYGVEVVAEPGKPATTRFVADRAGKFRLRCSVTCGSLHPFMIGELVVGPNLPFWRAVAALLVVTVGGLATFGLRERQRVTDAGA
jgi:cytochrome c oxidase subunit 2